ncbi:putative TetR family transcriptional regulator [Gordonia effusa NBRC 100432]|uniref:Putative TetR family transcriptional regulator n=1 Tax=Gordonia effusa NBRC 100432 TaxID=1077974 RepID=H0QX17_9ACTN|nr:TetR/AcrR family transcriptional regulator [Gordonia effusa]GAB17368.1 putative TetR family transcriptional regulator [Gordonia effusa NBRC 100432]
MAGANKMSSPEQSARRGRGRPPGPPVDVDARRETLLDAAETAIANTGPDVGLAEIAAAAGLTRSAVYAAFDDREALLTALAQRHSSIIVERMTQILADPTDPRAQIRASIDILARWFEDQPTVARLLFARLNAARGDQPSFVISSLVSILANGFTARGLDPAPAATWAHGVIGAVSATIIWWAEEQTVSRTEVVDHLTALVWGGFAGAGDTPIVS